MTKEERIAFAKKGREARNKAIQERKNHAIIPFAQVVDISKFNLSNPDEANELYQQIVKYLLSGRTAPESLKSIRLALWALNESKKRESGSQMYKLSDTAKKLERFIRDKQRGVEEEEPPIVSVSPHPSS